MTLGFQFRETMRGTYFMLDAPLCGSSFPVQFYIDLKPVGIDTLLVHNTFCCSTLRTP